MVQIRDLSYLETAFLRPVTPLSIDSYLKAVDVSLSRQSAQRPFDKYPDTLFRIVETLYATPEAPVFLACSDSVTLKELVIRVWSHQWPQLRGSFAFCTGAMASRSVAGRALDLQVIPHSAWREVRREVPYALLVDPEAPLNQIVPEEWVRLSADYVADADGHDFSSFLRHLEPLKASRSDFRPLVELSLCDKEAIRAGVSLKDFVEAIARRYPSPSEATALKLKAVGPGAPIAQVFGISSSERSVMQTMSTVDKCEAFDVEMLGIDERCKQLQIKDPAGASALILHLLERSYNRIGERVLKSLISATPSEVLLALIRENPSSLIAAVRVDPTLATNAEIWMAAPNFHNELFSATMSRGKLDSDFIKRFVSAMLEAGVIVESTKASNGLGNVGVRAVLDWCESSFDDAKDQLPYQWREYLRYYPEEVIEWLKESARRPRCVANAAQLLNPHSSIVHSAGSSIWIAAITATDPLPQTGEIWLNAFGLALAFDLNGLATAELVSLTFEKVHRAGADGHLGHEVWSLFENNLPSPPMWRSWDRCERLRRGLIDHYLRNDWPIVALLRCVQSIETFRAILETSDNYRPQGKRLLADMSAQMDVLKKSIPPTWWYLIKRYASIS